MTLLDLSAHDQDGVGKTAAPRWWEDSEPVRYLDEHGAPVEGGNTLEMAMLTFDGAVLMCDAAIVAGRLHTVMGAQRLIAAGLVFGGILVEIAECGRKTVGAMLVRRAAE